MLKNLYSSLVLFAAVLMFFGSVQIQDIRKTVTSYERVDRNSSSKDTTITYFMPLVEPTSKTEQKQSKGGVDVSCEIIPFEVNRSEKEYKDPVVGDINKPTYDVFRCYKIPSYNVNPDQIWFKIRVRNKQERVLKLIDVPIVMIIDGVQFSIPDDAMVEWKNSLVVQNFEKEYVLKGPKLNTLQNAKAIYISINDIPTSYDKAGTVQKKDNFEWYFSCSLNPNVKTEKIQYEYKEEVAYNEQCKSCNGSGRVQVNCKNCRGTGKVQVTTLSGAKETQACSICSGIGTVQGHCHNCSGNGIVYHRKSPMPKPTKQMTWTGWNVQVNTNPPGLNVCTVNPLTNVYDYCKTTNPGGDQGIAYYRSNGESTYYIQVEYAGKKYQIEPFDEKGERTQKVFIDFTKETPAIKNGKIK